MKQKVQLVTMVCIRDGKSCEFGMTRTEIVTPTEFNAMPKHFMTETHSEYLGSHKEIARTEVELDIPEIDQDEMREIKMQSLVAERSELEANFFVAKKRIDDEIASLQAIESKE